METFLELDVGRSWKSYEVNARNMNVLRNPAESSEGKEENW